MNEGTDPAANDESGDELVTRLNAALENYEIVSLLGQGGMGAVYKARQISLDRLVAIKVLSSQLITDGDDSMEFGNRFQREAKAMALLNHANIISVYDFGSTSIGEFYIVMEYIEGTDLYTLLKTGGITTEHVNGWISQICEALQYAHSKGIVHRDIKPANIMINTEGEVKIADFGLAKLTGPEHDEPALTMTNVAMGTPDYVAPEALEAEVEVDHRADLYAVGVMIYEMLTGKVPRGAWKSPVELVEGLDSRYEDLVLRAMDSDPQSRYQQATEIRSAIYEISTSPSTATQAEVELGEERSPSSRVSFSDISKFERMPRAPRPKSKPKSPAATIFGVGLASALLLGVLGWTFLGGDSPEEPEISIKDSETMITPEKPDAAKPKPKPPAEPVSREREAVASAATMEETTPNELEDMAADARASLAAADSTVNTGDDTAPEDQAASETTEPMEESGAEAQDDQEPLKEEPATTKTDEAEMASTSETESPLAGLPALNQRLSVYLRERRSRVNNLATQYLRGVGARLDRAANAGELAVTNAFRNEQSEVEQLQAALSRTSEDLIAAVANPTTLPPLAEDSPAELVSLRNTWTAERGKIRSDLNAKLSLSLQNLEAELTRAREFDKANALLAWRSNLLPEGGFTEEPVEESPPTEMAFNSPASMTGPLRAYSKVEPDHIRSLDISKAERYSDFKEVNLVNTGDWAALRENGTVVSSDERYDGLRRVRKLLDSGFVLYENGAVEHPGNEDIKPIRHVVDAASGFQGGIALTEDGEIEVFGVREEPPEPVLNPRIFETLWGSDDQASVAVDKEGNLHQWGTRDWVGSLSPDSPSEVIDIRAGWNIFLVLRDNGAVEHWPSESIPSNLPDFSQIRADGVVWAGQANDQRWHAWGDTYGGAVEKINEIGRAIDISYTVNRNGWAYLIWIPIEEEEGFP